MRTLALAMLFAAANGAAAAPAYDLVADYLDADMPAAEVPVDAARHALESGTALPGARVLVALREGKTASGTRYALAAWRSDARLPSFDAIVVLDTVRGARVLAASSTARDPEAVLAALLVHGTSEPVMAKAPPPLLAPERVEYYAAPAAWDLRFVVLYARDPGYRAGAATVEMALTEAHIQYALKLQAEGRALAAGPFQSGAPGDGPIGMMLLRVRDLATAQALATADPAVVAGRLTATVREWSIPAGKL